LLHRHAMAYNQPMQIIDYQYIDPALLLDEYHPANQPFYQHQKHIQRAIVAQSVKCRPKHIEAAKLHVRGMPNKEIAEQLGYAQNTVVTIFARKNIQELIELLHFYDLHLEGPSIEHRKRMLNEIAVDNQAEDPKTSIAAVREMNSMDGVGRDKVDTKVNITINNTQLPKGVLDV